MAISADKATLAELQTVYGLEDLHDILEVMSVDSMNERRMAAISAAMRQQATLEGRAKGRR